MQPATDIRFLHHITV